MTGLRNLKYLLLELTTKKLKSFFLFLIAQRALPALRSVKYFSLGQQSILFLLVLLILAILYLRFYNSPSFPEKITHETVIELSGEVEDPGVHVFETPPTLPEVIERAGGLKVTVPPQDLPPEILETGTLLTISKESSQGTADHSVPRDGAKPDVIRIKVGTMEANKLLVFSIPLDLNRVSAEDLCLVPGIGQSLAREIVAYRERRRGFRSVQELKSVRGIGEKKYQSVKDFFVVKQ